MADTMRAVVRDRYGSPDVLRMEHGVPVPRPGTGEVLVRVQAAGLDRGAWHVMYGTPYLMRLAFGLRRPRTPTLGLDMAGTVVTVGPEPGGFAVGDEVFGIARGSFAEYAVAPVAKLVPKPREVSFAQASVVPVSGLTALQGLRDAGRLTAGQHVLVTGASGGVGSFAVQLAKAFGAEVTAVCSAAKADYVRSLGADDVLDYRRDGFGDGEVRYDLVLDLAGNPSISRLRRALTPTGTAVVAGGEHGGIVLGGLERQLGVTLLSPFVKQRLCMLLSREVAEDVEVLATHLAAGDLTPPLERTYPLTEVATAMRYLESGQVRGKVALVP